MKGDTPQSGCGHESDDNWDNKLVIDLEANMNSDKTVNSSAVRETSRRGESILEDAKPVDNPEQSAKPKLKRGAKPQKLEQIKQNDEVKLQKSTKVEKPTPSKPGRKRKEKPPSPVVAETELETGHSPELDTPATPLAGASAPIGARKSKAVNESSPRVDASTNYDYCSAGCMVEPDSLGPCDPGTHVCLEGIVWQETRNGVLVVNVTWRGKTYMGTLLDATKHDWAPPSDLDGRTQKGRGKRSRIPLSDTFKEINERKLRKEIRKQSVPVPASPPSKSDSGKRKSRASECEAGEPSQKRGRATSQAAAQPPTPPLIECPAPNCGKKFKQKSGLKYHQSHAHQDIVSNQVSEGSDIESKVELTSSPENKKKKGKSQNEPRSMSDTIIELCGHKEESSTPVKENVEAAHDSYTHTDDSRDTQFEGTGAKIMEEGKHNAEAVVTSVITSAPPAQPSTASVPVATIIPQMALITMAGEKDKFKNKPGLSSVTPMSRPMPSGPPKLLPKSSSGANMAPISTLSSQLNSSLKPIQPKPTILGEVNHNHALSDFHKKVKRKSSVGREDVTQGGDLAKSFMSSTQTDIQKLNQTVQRIELENEKLKGVTERDPSDVTSKLLQSPSYSDISDEGHVENGSRGFRKDINHHNATQQKSALNNVSPMYAPSTYRVATVSPQKTATDRKSEPTPVSRNPPSYMSAPIIHAALEDGLRQREYHQSLASPFNEWAMSDDPLRSKERSHTNTTRSSGSGKLSPKPPKDADVKASSDRMQLLRENMEVKSQMPSTVLGESPKDYSMSSVRASEELSKMHMHMQMHMQEQKLRDQERGERKKDLISSQSGNSNHSPGFSHKDGGRDDRLHHAINPSSPLQGLGGMYPFMPQLYTGYLGSAGASHMFPPNLPPMKTFPYHYGFPMPDMKDSSLHAAHQFGGKPSHKIHELEDVNRTSKSPKSSSSDKERPVSSSHPNKNQPVYSPMFNPYGMSCIPPK